MKTSVGAFVDPTTEHEAVTKGYANANAVYPPGHIDGLATSWFSITAVKIAVGTCRDSTNAHNLDVTATLTATISASGANGLNSRKTQCQSHQ